MTDIKVRMNLNNGEYIDIDKRNGLKSVESLSQTTGQPNEIFYGVIDNSGSFDVIDRQGIISDYIDKEIIDNSNIPVEIYANNKKVQSHIITNSNFDTHSKTFSTTMNNDLSFWDKLYYNGYEYNDSNCSLYELLVDVLTSIQYSQNEIDEMLETIVVCGSENQEISIKNYLELINLEYPYLEQDTIRNTIKKICTIAQLQVYKNNNNKIKFVNARPLTTKLHLDNHIFIPLKNQMSIFTENKLLKNKYDAVEIDEKKVTNEIDFKSIFHTENQPSNSLFNLAKVSYANTGSLITGDKAHAIARIESYYTDGSFDISIKKNLGLKKCLNFINYPSNDIDNKIWVLNYEEVEGIKSDYPINGIDSQSYEYRQTLYPAIIDDTQWSEVKQISGTLTPPSISTSIEGYGNTATITIEDNSFINISVNEDIATVNYHILTELRTFQLSGYESNYYISGKINIKKALSLDISLYGTIRTINLKDVSVSDKNVPLVNTFARIENNEILQDKTTFNGIKISSVIKDTIKSDYKKGISNADIKTNCADLYDINGNKIKDWSKGEIINVGDVVKIEGNNKLWEVTGRNFEYSGCPFNNLELQEIANSSFTLSISAENTVVSVIRNGKELQNGDTLYYGDKLTISASGTALFDLDTLIVNENTFESGNTYIVVDDVNIIATAKEGKYPQFANASWQEVRDIVQNTEVFKALCESPDYDWGVGQTKFVTLPNGNNLAFMLSDAQIGRYDYADGSRKTNAVFEMTEVLGNFGQFAMNEENTNAGGWATSLLNKYLNETAINGYLTEEMQSIIPEIKIKSANGGDTNYSGITESICKLFIPSAEEVNLSSEYYYDGEGYVWDWYNITDTEGLNNRRSKVCYNGSQFIYPTWRLRSPLPESTTNFVSISGEDGTGSKFTPSNLSYSIGLCFAI